MNNSIFYEGSGLAPRQERENEVDPEQHIIHPSYTTGRKRPNRVMLTNIETLDKNSL